MSSSVPLRIAGVRRGRPAKVVFDNTQIEAFEGEMLAAALLAAGISTLRHGPVDGGPRGLFCAMGSCQECVVLVDDRRVEACRVIVTDGLEVRSIR